MTTLKNTKFDALLDYMRDKLRAEYEASANLQAEFFNAEGYAAYTLNSPTARPLIRRWRADFEDAANMAAFDAAKAAGRVRVLHG